MMTKKTMTILSVFMIVALTAVGFAAWLIVGTIDAETTGSFVSNELEDKYFKVEVNFDNDGNVADDKGDIIFGRPSEDYDYETGSWLSYSNRDPKEKLSATATVKFIPDAGFETNTMEYYLREVIEGETEAQDKTQHRTIRVVIDIAELFGNDGEQTSKFYEWYDWAVQLGYIQYPTAKWVAHAGAAKADTDLKWGKIENVDGKDVVKALEASELASKNFEDNFLYIDLSYDMFDIHSSKEYATANIKIDFAWGEKVNKINPYKHFATISDPESETTVDNYLKVIDGTPVTYALEATITEDNEETDNIDERDQGLDTDSVIRNKDLAQRMLDYLRDYLNYDETNESGIQFSIVLSEGTPVVKTNNP